MEPNNLQTKIGKGLKSPTDAFYLLIGWDIHHLQIKTKLGLKKEIFEFKILWSLSTINQLTPPFPTSLLVSSTTCQSLFSCSRIPVLTTELMTYQVLSCFVVYLHICGLLHTRPVRQDPPH
jgi:hypothetical protein